MAVSKLQRQRIRMDLAEELCNWLNEQDTSSDTVKTFRAKLYGHLLEIR